MGTGSALYWRTSAKHFGKHAQTQTQSKETKKDKKPVKYAGTQKKLNLSPQFHQKTLLKDMGQIF